MFVWLPLIALSYFGSLATAAWFSPDTYNLHKAISKLFYPADDPKFHYVTSLGVAFAAILMLPLAEYIRQRLRWLWTRVTDVGAFVFGVGAFGLMLASLIVSHPAHGTSAFPRVHEMLARTAASGLGAGMILLWACAAKGYLASATRSRELRRLLLSWSLLTLPALSVVLLRAAVGAHLDWSNPIYQKLQNRALWHLGFWEWLGSVDVFLFLLSAALFLPEHNSEQ